MKPCKTVAENRCWEIKYISRQIIRAWISNYINLIQRKRGIPLLLDLVKTLFLNSPVCGTKIIVNKLRRFNTTNLFLFMKLPIFVARFQKCKSYFYGNSMKNNMRKSAFLRACTAHRPCCLRVLQALPTRWHPFPKNTCFSCSSWWVPLHTNQTPVGWQALQSVSNLIFKFNKWLK